MSILLALAAPCRADVPTESSEYAISAQEDGAGSVLASGDVDADGYADLVTGGPLHLGGMDVWGNFLYDGLAEVILGGPAGIGAGPAWTWYSGWADAHAGAGIAAGDVNGDGFDDVLVGAPHYYDG